MQDIAQSSSHLQWQWSAGPAKSIGRQLSTATLSATDGIRKSFQDLSAAEGSTRKLLLGRKALQVSTSGGDNNNSGFQCNGAGNTCIFNNNGPPTSSQGTSSDQQAPPADSGTRAVTVGYGKAYTIPVAMVHSRLKYNQRQADQAHGASCGESPLATVKLAPPHTLCL